MVDLLIDTNIFLEILLDQEKSEECEELLFKLDKLEEEFFVSGFALHSIEVIMTREGKKQDLKSFLKDIAFLGVQRVNTTTLEEAEIVSLMKEKGLDFDDSTQYFICEKMDLNIISYDNHFDQTGIERVTPKEILEKL